MIRTRHALGAAFITIVLPTAALAQSEGRFVTDVSAMAGFSNNPFAMTGDDTGSGYLSIDIAPRYQLLRSRSTLTVSADASLQQYLSKYSRNDSYSGALDYAIRPSERVTAHTRLDVSSAIVGAFNNYSPFGTGQFGPTVGTGAGGIGVGSGTGGGTGAITPIVSPGAFPLLTDIGLFGFRNRRRLARLSGDASVGVTERDTLTFGASAEVTRYRQLPLFGDYEAYSASVGYSRRLSDRLSVGLRGSGSSYNYRAANSDSRVGSIEATASGRLSPVWTFDGSLGASFVSSDGPGSTRRTSVSGSASFCRRGELSTLCIQGSRSVSPTGLQGTQYVTSAGFTWSKQIGERENLSLSGSYSKVGGDNSRLVTNGLPLQTEYAQGVVGYDRQLRQRLRLVASANYRQLLNNAAGRPKDFGGQLGLSYRLGDLR